MSVAPFSREQQRRLLEVALRVKLIQEEKDPDRAALQESGNGSGNAG